MFPGQEQGGKASDLVDDRPPEGKVHGPVGLGCQFVELTALLGASIRVL